MMTTKTKQRYEMTETQYTTLMLCMQPVPAIALNIPLQSAQERANSGWRLLGKEMGFQWDTAEPSNEGEKVFMAIPLPVSGDISTITGEHDVRG